VASGPPQQAVRARPNPSTRPRCRGFARTGQLDTCRRRTVPSSHPSSAPLRAARFEIPRPVPIRSSSTTHLTPPRSRSHLGIAWAAGTEPANTTRRFPRRSCPTHTAPPPTHPLMHNDCKSTAASAHSPLSTRFGSLRDAGVVVRVAQPLDSLQRSEPRPLGPLSAQLPRPSVKLHLRRCVSPIPDHSSSPLHLALETAAYTADPHPAHHLVNAPLTHSLPYPTP
jgi:hypothetical protein